MDNQYILVAGPVKYMEKNEINQLHRPDDNGELGSIFNDFNFTKYLRLLKVKRNAYKYEDEMRLFLISKEGKVGNENLIIPIPAKCPDDVIKSRRWGRIVEMLYLDPNSTEEELEDYKKHFAETKFGLETDRFDISDIYNSFSYIIIGEKKDDEIKRKQEEMNELLEKQKKMYLKGFKASI